MSSNTNASCGTTQVMIASGSLIDTLQTLQDSSKRPLVIASADR